MDDAISVRMRSNLTKGITCLVVGALAILVGELLWDSLNPSIRSIADEAGVSKADDDGGPPGYADLAAFAFDGDEGAVGMRDISSSFIEECFDTQDLGEACSSLEGGVVGITSTWNADDLFRECARRLGSHGWIQVSGGQPLRCTFLKEAGRYRWAFLDVAQMSDSSVAVMVLEEGA